MRAALVACMLLGVPLPAAAANWLKGCQTTNSGSAMSLSPGGFVCNIPTSATDNSSGFLDVHACENYDVLYFDDVDGDGVAGGGTGSMRVCPTNTLSTANGGVGESACWKLENVTFDGNPATNTEAVYGAAANWIFWDQISYTTPAEPIRVIVRCNGPQN